jgi:hypothetical protein
LEEITETSGLDPSPGTSTGLGVDILLPPD